MKACCDVWDFDRAKDIISRDRRFGPLLIYLRRVMNVELGSVADEKSEPWQSLAKEFGDRATEAALQLIDL